MSTSSPDGPGLRERKKAKTRAAIQQHALRLFMAQGYAETTVEQIAAAAEVSQSTFFRYFATKEETVLYDQLDPVMIASFIDQPAELSPLAAVRGALHDVFANLPSEQSELELGRQKLIAAVPELRIAAMDQFRTGMALLTTAAAQRMGLSPDDFNVRVWSGAVIGVAFAAFLATGGQEFFDAIDRGFALLEAGLPLT
jgi:AcrR family transcriptional regulator